MTILTAIEKLRMYLKEKGNINLEENDLKIIFKEEKKDINKKNKDNKTTIISKEKYF